MNLQTIWSECVHLKKKLSLFKEVIIFSIISFKIGFFWYCEILLFSGIFGLELVVWAMWTVIGSECAHLKKLSLFKELQFSL